MKRFKCVTFGLVSMALFLVSCDKGTKNNSVSNDEPIEIEFIKEGELTLSNQDSIIKNLDIEIATNDYERQVGLMNRSHMEENQGMLFVFEGLNNTGFWMKDTRIPLDIIFVAEDSTVINVQANAKPYDLNNYPANAPYRYVLEVNGGQAEKWGVKDGVTKLNWKKVN